MTCPKCKAQLPPGAILCGKCGAKFKTKVCPHCKMVILSTATVCPHCHKNVSQLISAAKAQAAQNKPKKPLQKQWWFWTICAVLVIGIIGNIGNALNGRQDSGTKASSSSLAATPTPEPTAVNLFLSAPAGTGDVMNGIKTEKIGQWEYIKMNKADAKAASMEDFLAFTDTFEDKDLNWFSILFEDGTGICFPSGNRIAGSYGPVDEEGCITSVTGDIVLESDLKAYEYIPRREEATPEPTSEPTPKPTSEPAASSQEESASSGGQGGANNFDTYDNPEQQQTQASFVLNTSSQKVHRPGCRAVKKIAPENYQEFYGTLEEALAQEGYTTCGICF